MTDGTSPIRLLLVDDEPEFLEAMTRALGRRNIQVHAADGAGDAIEALEGKTFDVAILDVKMPGMDGVGLFRIVHRRWPDLPVIMLTGHGTVRQAFETSREGVFDYLSKPCDVDKLTRLVRRAAGQAQEPTAGPEELGGLPIRVLLCDDEEEFLDSQAKVLGRRGFEVVAAASADAALKRLGEETFDVAVCDVRMPGMDGLEALRTIKRDHPDVEVILLTGHPSVSTALRGVRDGAFDFIEKPHDVEALADRIRAAARQRRLGLERDRQEMVQKLVETKPS